jgi:trehalose-phosphatase
MSIDGGRIDAVVFDTDGVVTRTAAVHFAAWKAVFDPFLASHASGSATRPFLDGDYRRHVDGIGRYDGVAALLAARGIDLERGDPDDPPGDGTICALGNRKDAAFADAVRRHGVAPYLTTCRFVEQLRAVGIRTAVVSASRNCQMVLEAAGVSDLFEVRIDGRELDELGLPGKPDPSVFLEAAARLGVGPSRAAVVEDAVSGVRAGRAGGFATVIGLDRTRRPDELSPYADLVVPDAADLELVDGRLRRSEHVRVRLADLPAALDDTDLPRMLADRPVAVFLDYDGTLTPIVDRPQDALLAPDAAAELAALAGVCTVGIISGRDLDDVAALVDLEGLWLAGSHGFDVVAPDGTRHQFEQGTAALPALDAAELALAAAIELAPGSWVERKRFAIAVHHRAAADRDVPALERAVGAIADGDPALRMTGGKKIFELRPAADWDKGKALRWLCDAAAVPPDALVVFVGDDVTDEDALDEVRRHGLGVVVGSEDRSSAAHDRVDDTSQVVELLRRLRVGVGEG